MANSVLSQSSQDVLRRLGEQLKECMPLDESPGEQGHGLDYALGLKEIRKVSPTLYVKTIIVNVFVIEDNLSH